MADLDLGAVTRSLYEAISDLEFDGRAVKPMFGYPTQWNELPIVAYTLASQDNKIRAVSKLVVGYDVAYNVDIWCETPSQCVELYLLIDKALYDAGYTCTSQGTIYETEARWHLRATAQATVDLVQGNLR